MQTLGLLGAAVILFAVGIAMVLYELARIRAGRRILQGSDAVQVYWMTYLMMFALSITTALKAVIG
jgi:divalent metal cation (Fe/Co/Zn/Cd) transporter